MTTPTGIGPTYISPIMPEFCKINLSASETPLLQKTFSLTVAVTPLWYDVKNARILISLPEGIELVSGALISNKAMKEGTPTEHTILIRPIKTEELRIDVTATAVQEDGHDKSDSASCFIVARATRGRFSTSKLLTTRSSPYEGKSTLIQLSETSKKFTGDVYPAPFSPPSPTDPVNFAFFWEGDEVESEITGTPAKVVEGIKKTIGISPPDSQIPSAPSGQEAQSYIPLIALGVAIIIIVAIFKK